MLRPLLAALLLAALAAPAEAQWTNRYPAIPGYSHHIYLEGFELPTASAGITDPAASPDGRQLAFASKGWLWVMDLETRRARRVTSGAEVDARPAWSPDGRQLAFVRDDSRETWIVVLNLETGTEQIASSEPGLELDPAWMPDGRALVFTAATDTGLDLHSVELATGERTRLTEFEGLMLAPTVLPDGSALITIAKEYADEIRQLDLRTGKETILVSDQIQSQTRPALSPDGQTLALTVPHDDGWELVLADRDAPSPTLRLASSRAPQLAPSWSADGETIYFAQTDADERLRLMQIPSAGGTPSEIEIADWDWGVELATLTVRTRIDGQPSAARLALRDGAGHPLFPDAQTWFDGETGTVYTYSPGEITLQVPVGTVEVAAVRGLDTPVATTEVEVSGGSTSVTLTLQPIWDARAAGWISGDLHFHLNYGGPYALTPSDLEPILRGENLDVGTPLVANLHDRYEDDEWWGQSLTNSWPFLAFGQEIRSHFFGHVGLVGTETLFNPWIWGPGYEVFGDDDRENATATAHARAEGGMATYVHPVSLRDPFSPGNEWAVPFELVADGVLGDIDAIEVVCLWTDDFGTSSLWYRLLNLGQPIVPSAGSDVMSNFYRTMAPGSARAYVQTEDVSYGAFLDGLKAGRSFVTTGPFLEGRIGGASPGGVIQSGSVDWSVDLYSAVPVDRIELVVNGRVVATEDGLAAPGRRSVRGTVELPEGGWAAIRAVGDTSTGWPSMAAYPFAHTAPVWIGTVGSTDPASERNAARDLLQVLNVSQQIFENAYDGVDAPRQRSRFVRARAELERRAGR